MRARTAVFIAVALGLAVAIPALGIVGLGLYGESLGGESVSIGRGGAQLTLRPAEAKPGQEFTVEGKNWPPRSEVRLELRTPAGDDERRIPLALAVTSRSGSFALQLVLPETLYYKPGRRLTIEAVPILQQGVADVGAELTIRPFSTTLDLSVVDAGDRTPLADASVEILDGFGAPLAVATTDARGRAIFEGLPPGRDYRVRAQRLDYLEASVAQAVEDGGATEAEIGLEPAAGNRLYLTGEFEGDSRTVRLIGVDLASSLPVEEEFESAVWGPSGYFPPGDNVVLALRLGMGLSLVTPQGGDPGQPLALNRESLERALAAIRLIDPREARDPNDVVIVRYLGTNAATGSLLVAASEHTSVEVFQIDPAAGNNTHRTRVAGLLVGPAVSSDGERVWLVDGYTGALTTIRVSDGSSDTRSAPSLRGVVAIATDGARGVYAFSSQSGVVMRVSDSGEQALAVVRELKESEVSMAVSPDGARIVVAAIEEKLLFVLDAQSGEVVALMPTALEVSEILFTADSSKLLLVELAKRKVHFYTWPGLELLRSVVAGASSRAPSAEG